MKFTQAQLIEAVKAVGVPVVEVVEEGSDFTADTFLTAIDTAREPIIKQKVLPELEAEATRKISGLVGDKLMVSLAKASGIPRAKFNDIATDEEKIKFALDTFKETFSKDTEGLREEMTALVQKHTEALAKVTADNEAALKVANDKYIDRDIQSYLATSLKDAPLPEGADRNLLGSDFKRHLADKYNLTYDEATKAVQLFKKDNPAAPAMNPAGTGFVDLQAEAKDFFTPRGQWLTDMRRAAPKLPNGQPYVAGSGTPPPGEDNGAADPLKSMNEGLNKFLADKAIPA